ncbi:MAG: M16 family metallopeptidase, partial [Armatimonadota bacterium]
MHQTLRPESRAVRQARLARVAACATLVAALASAATAAVERAVLRNGITVIARQDASSDIAGVQLLIGVGQEHEGADHDGIRTLLGEMLLQGLRARLQDSAELEPLRRQQDAAPDRVPFNTGTHWGFASVQGTVTSDALPACLRLLASAAFEAELTQEQLVKSRDALNATRARSLERDPVRQTYLLLRKALTGEGKAAVSLLGTKEALGGISLDDVFGFWKSAYVPSNAYVAIVSPLPTSKAVALVKDAFGRFPAGARLAGADPLPADAADVEVEGSRDLLRLASRNSPSPASLMVGVPIPPTDSPDAVVAEVISAILGRPDGSLARDRELT